MNEPTPIPAPLAGQKDSPAGARPLPALGFPLGLINIYWALYFAVGAAEKPYFYGFIYGMASALVFLVCFLGWWFSRAMPRVDKWLGFAMLVLGAWVAAKYSDRSANALILAAVGLPLAVTGMIAWLFLVKRRLLPSARVGLVAVIALAWGSLLCVRTDGLDSKLRSRVRWRWTPTSEEIFLTERAAGLAPVAAARPASTAVTPSDPNSWAAFRGPGRDGVLHGTHLTTDWKTSPPALLWKHAVGPAWSALIVVGDYLYTQEQRGPKEAVVCYESATGRELWSHEDETRFDEGVSGPGPRATPTFAQGRVLAMGGTGILNCLDAQTGKLAWSRDVKSDAQAKAPLWGYASSPLVVGPNVIVFAGGESGKGLLAYHLDSGQPAWTADAGHMSYSSPQLTTISGTPQCLMLHDAGLTSVDPATGKKLWETGKAMPGAPRPGQPHLVGESQLAVSVLDAPGVSLVKVANTGGQWSASPVWASKDLKTEFPDFVVYDGHAYGFDISIFSCIDLATGKRTWKEGRYGRGQVILLADQALLVVLSEGGEVILLAADPQAQKELGRFQALDGKCWNHPVIAGGRLYLRNAAEMACYTVEPSKPTAAR